MLCRRTRERSAPFLPEILPNKLAIVASRFIFAIIFAILTQAGLAFLGPSSMTTSSWASML
jgi:peptide/nickel transport system permease protein